LLILAFGLGYLVFSLIVSFVKDVADEHYEDIWCRKCLKKFIQSKENNKEDNIFVKGTSDTEAINTLEDAILGKEWYVVDPLSGPQVNTHAVAEILYKYLCARKARYKAFGIGLITGVTLVGAFVVFR